MKVRLWRLVPVLVLAGSALAGCASTGSQSDGELRATANEALKGGEYERVVALDSELLRRTPEDYNATLQRAIAFDRLGRTNVAFSDYSRAIDLDPSKPLPRLYRANLLLRSGHSDAALTDVHALRGMDTRPHEKAAAAAIEGTVHQSRRQFAQALESYNRAIQIGRSDPDLHSGKHYRDALHNAAQCYYHLGDFTSALGAMGEKQKANERAGVALGEEDYYMLGLFSYLSGQFEEARGHFAHVSPQRRAKAAEVLNDQGFFEGYGS